MRHIVHVVGSLEAGGVQKLVLGLATTGVLARDQHTVVCLEGSAGDLRPAMLKAMRVAECRVTGCRFDWCPSFRLRSFVRSASAKTFSGRFALLLRRLRADVVHSHLTDRIDQQTLGARWAGVPVVWTIHGLYQPDTTTAQRWRTALRYGGHTGIRVTADSSPLAIDFLAREIAPSSAIDVVHAGADVSEFSKPRERVAGWRSRLGIPPTATLFGASGRLSKVKAHDLLIQATQLLAQRDDASHVAIAGSGAWKGFLEQEVVDRGLVGRVHFLGFQSDVPAFLRELDVYVLPSRSEGFPLALIEALAMNLPCVATDVGGVREMLGANGGIVVPAEDPSALAHGMEAMLDAGVRQTFQEGGFLLASKYSYERCADEFDRVYRRLLAV